MTKRPFRPRELLFGLAVLPGVALVVGGVPEGMRAGVVVGAISAVFVGLFGSLNKRMVRMPTRSPSPRWNSAPARSP